MGRARLGSARKYPGLDDSSSVGEGGVEVVGEGGGGDVPGPGVGLPPVVDSGQLLQHLRGEPVLGRGHRVQLSAVPGNNIQSLSFSSLNC